MVPLTEYATVLEGSTLFEAVLALEKAQEDFDHTKYRHRGVLILNKTGQVIGKLSQMDVLRALVPHPEDAWEVTTLRQFAFSSKFILNLQKQRLAGAAPITDICTKAVNLKVEDFMQTLTEGEHVADDASIDAAIYQLLSGSHLSLLVTQGKAIIGVLRLTDVFAAVFHLMKECEIRQSNKDKSR
jgi:CBS domain